MRIYLIGFMGCGKSSLGRRLARKLNYPFVDLDREIEKATGKSIPELFDEEGEDWFRRQEQQLLHRTAEMPRGVIATGGGTPCHFDNMDFINTHGMSVYLKMNPVSLAYRLEHARKKRPLIGDLKGEELLESIRQTLAKRDPVYSKAHCIIKGESAKPSQIETLVFGA